MARAAIRFVAVNAARVQSRAQRLFTQMPGEIERAGAQSRREWPQAAIEYKIGWEEELERRARLKIEAPEPIPRPDDIHIDLRANAVAVRGPISNEDKARHDRVLAWRDDLHEEFADLIAGSPKRGEEKVFHRRMAVEPQHDRDRIDRTLAPRRRKPLEGRLWLTQDERTHDADLERKSAKRRVDRDRIGAKTLA